MLRALDDVRDADIINLTASVIGGSIAIVERNSVRTLDALHIASAIEWEADLFVTSDKQQLAAAKRAGLKAEKV